MQKNANTFILQGNLTAARDSGGMTSQHIGIIGMSLRYPGEKGPNGFWFAALSSNDVQQQVPFTRWNNDAKYSPDSRPGKLTTATRSDCLIESDC